MSPPSNERPIASRRAASFVGDLGSFGAAAASTAARVGCGVDQSARPWPLSSLWSSSPVLSLPVLALGLGCVSSLSTTVAVPVDLAEERDRAGRRPRHHPVRSPCRRSAPFRSSESRLPPSSRRLRLACRPWVWSLTWVVVGAAGAAGGVGGGRRRAFRRRRRRRAAARPLPA